MSSSSSNAASSPDESRLSSLLGEALSLPPEERDAYLDRACADAPALRDELDALLSQEDDAAAFFGDDVASFLGAEAEHVAERLNRADPWVGSQIGPYQLDDVLGHGGMGTVYAAHRADDAYEQKVALKLIRHNLDASALQRFVAERQILARLTHPGIARLLDGGVAPDGRPYLVMERVNGRPLLQYCDEEGLSLRTRVRLFQDVCKAVQYAHRNLVVHRDLKPSNILVSDNGTAKLLDFGIAKALDNTDALQVQTQTGKYVVTPAYAAPEQLTGNDVTTATDVYALGILLYELLTGERPYDLPDATPSVRLATIEEGPPPPPSQAPNTGREAPDDDLDTIVLHALRAEPDLRYDSAAALQQDLDRWLDDRPIQARPPTARYRLQKFVTRNRTLVGGVTLGLALLVLALGVAVWQARVAAEQRDRARQEAQKAEQVASFMRDLFRSSDPTETLGDTVTAATMLRRGWKTLPSELAGQPQLQQSMLAEIANIMLEMGNYPQADSVLQDALALRDSTAPSTVEYGRILFLLGQTHDLQGQYAEAERLHRSALSVRRAALGNRHPDVGRSLNQLASMLTYQGEYETAASLYDQALSLLRRELNPKHEDVTGTLHNYAWMRRKQGHFAAADSLYEHAYRLALKTLPPNHPDILLTLNSLALVRKQRGMLAEAGALYRKVLDRQTRVLSPSHPNVGITHSNLGMLLHKRGQLDSAATHVQEALSIWQTELGSEHPYVAVGLSNLGMIERERGQLEASESAFRAALSLNRQVLPESHPRTASTLVGLGKLLVKQDRPEAARPYLQEAHQIRTDAHAPSHPARVESGLALGRCLYALGDMVRAETVLSATHDAACTATSPPSLCTDLQQTLSSLSGS